MVFKNEKSLDAIKDNSTPSAVKEEEMYDADGDGQESVTEYIEKKKILSDAKNEEEEQAKKEKKDKNKEDLQQLGNVVGKVTSVITSVPHYAAFGLGMGAGGLAEKIKEMIKQESNGKTK